MATTNQTDISGRVVNILVQGDSKEGKPSIFVVKAIELKKDFTVVCEYFCPLHEGDSFYAVVTKARHPRYEEVLLVQRPPFVQPPVDRDAIIDCFRRILTQSGFGAIKSGKLYDAFLNAGNGRETVIDHLTNLSKCWADSQDDDLFLPYMGIITTEQIKKLVTWWHKNRTIRRLYLIGLTDGEIERCHLPADLLYKKCIKNPYALPALDMEKCDEILFRLNRKGNPIDIRCGQIVRKIYSSMKNGHTGMEFDTLIRSCPDLMKYMDHLKEEFEVKFEFRMLYLPFPYLVEVYVANKIVEMISRNPPPDQPMDEGERESASFKEKMLSAEQKAAVQGALDNVISVVRGPAGAGKTTVIKEIKYNDELMGLKTRIVAPTGKAVAQCRRATASREATTIHQLIAKAKLIGKFDRLIVDESSMVTTALMYRLFLAFPFPFKITFIGDCNQLPPIEWGTFFEQIIWSSYVPVFTLTTVHRVSSADNGILSNSMGLANLIQNGFDEYEPFEFEETPNFQFRPGEINEVYTIVRTLHQEGVSQDQVTIVSPFNSDLDELNATVQQIFNEGQPQVMDGIGKMWASNDRVMLTDNDYNINVFNGEEGLVKEVDPKEIAVTFHDGVLHYFLLARPKKAAAAKNWKERKAEAENAKHELFSDNLCHSWAITVHKSQGNEWENVIVYIPKDRGSSMMRQKLIYTAITRAKKRVWIVGDIAAFKAGAFKTESPRSENLAIRIQNLIEPPEPEPEPEPTPIKAPRVIRMIGMAPPTTTPDI